MPSDRPGRSDRILPPSASPPTPARCDAPAAAVLPRLRTRAEDSLAQRLATANRALWTATLALMTAFMQTAAPAHRYLLARRIARNLETLSMQDCFDAGCRASFARLATRWNARAQQFSPQPPRRPRLFDLLA